MKKILLILISLFCCMQSYAQRETLARFIILEAVIDGEDATDFYIDQSAYVVFYNVDEEPYFAIMCPKDDTQSYGKLTLYDHKGTPETSEMYKMDEIKFRWSYINSYDSKRGSAMCYFTKIYKPNAVAFELSMVTEDMSRLTFKGYMHGSLK